MLVLCTCELEHDSDLTLRTPGREWSSVQVSAIGRACADVEGCGVEESGVISVSRRSDSIKRALVDTIPGRRRVLVDDDIVDPDDLEAFVRDALRSMRP